MAVDGVRTGLVRQVRGFFLGSLAGVVVDLAVFQSLVWLGAPAWASNLVSSAAAIVVTYRLVTRHAFDVAGSLLSFVVFVGWYAISISAFSLLIQVVASGTGWPPLVAKVLTLPLSFGVNFLASRVLFSRLVGEAPSDGGRAPMSDDGPRHRRVGLVFVVVAWIVLAATASLFLFRSSLNSDSLFADDIAHDLLVMHGSWWDWRLTPAPALFPDLLLYFAFYGVLPSAALRIAAVSIVQAGLLALAAVFAARSINPRLGRFGQAFVVLGVALVTWLAARSDVWLYFNSTNNHFAALLAALLSTGLVVSLVRRPRWRSAILLAIVVALALVSTQVTLIAVIAPIGAATIVGAALAMWKVGLGWRQATRTAGPIIAALAAGYVVATAATRVLIPNAGLGTRLNESIEGVAASLGWLAQAVWHMVTAHTVGAIGFDVIVAAAIAYVAIRIAGAANVGTGTAGIRVGFVLGARHSRRRGVAVAIWLVLFIAPIDLIGAVASGGIVDPYSLRYFQSPLALLLLVAAVLALDHISSRTIVVSALAGAVAIALLAATVVTYPGMLRSSAAAGQAVAARSAIACVERLRAEGVALNRGVANYWEARGVGFQTDPVVPVTAVDANLTFFDWMTTEGPALHPASYRSLGSYDFLILNTDVVPPYPAGYYFGMTLSKVEPLLPRGGVIHTCDDPYTVIVTWSGDELQRRIDSAFAYFRGMHGDPGAWTLPASAFLSPSGVVSDGTIALSADAAPDVAMYGALQTLPPGGYSMTVDTDPLAPGASGFAFAVDAASGAELGRSEFSAGSASTTVRFTVSGSQARSVDLRVQLAHGPLTIRSVSFAPAK